MIARLKILVVLILVLAAGAAVYWWQYYYQPQKLTANEIRVSGNIETIEVQMAFKISGRVVERPVDEGFKVKKDELIAKLDTSDLKCNVDLRRAEVGVARSALDALEAGSRLEEKEAAKAAMEKAAHTLADLEAGSRPQEIATAEAVVDAAAAEVVRTQADLGRSTALYQQKVIPAESYDAVRTAHDVAVQKHRQAVEQLKLAREGSRKEQIEQARAQFAQAKAQYELVMAGPRQEDIEQGRARLAQAEAALALAETQLGYAEIRSPLAGIVLSKNIEPGEYVSPGTAVVTIGDIENVWLRAYIEESELGPVKVGQTAWVTTDSHPEKKYKGRVSFIAQDAEFTPKNVQTQKERVKLVYRIKIDIDNKGMELKPGMPADAVIELGSEATKP